MQKNNNRDSTILAIVVFIFILYLLGSCSSNESSSTSSVNGEIRCSYCGKVIFYNGRAIHCTNKYLNTYKCDYCGHSNVIK
jgi:DNA-directed RNA polymerase subunit RPC12/RpoP